MMIVAQFGSYHIENHLIVCSKHFNAYIVNIDLVSMKVIFLNLPKIL